MLISTTKAKNRTEYMREYGKRYRLKNKEKIKKRMEKYRFEHKEEEKEHNKRYYQNNKEKITEYFKRYRQNHREQLNEKGRQDYINNREKRLKQIRIYQKNNSGKCKVWTKKHYDKRRQFIDNYKLSKRCSICGYNKCAAALEFHHINRNKEFTIAHLVEYKLEIIKKEMGKCIILCANCHRELHKKEKEGEKYACDNK